MPAPGGKGREPTPLEKNRALAQWLEFQLRQVRGRIRDLEAQELLERQEQGRRKPGAQEPAGRGRREVEAKP
ncbi:hypothetical protein OG596_34120 [Streptomyces sp. NBC_01102]|uniref:hypothetical protein n=1 Tax=Streptomyces sp. NBC_01102 TaxID=2903749 RepID=UPI003865F07E|nr:hypothetical protein OG596_34120 [Streptomyces sp. NBC_01102]